MVLQKLVCCKAILLLAGVSVPYLTHSFPARFDYFDLKALISRNLVSVAWHLFFLICTGLSGFFSSPYNSFQDSNYSVHFQSYLSVDILPPPPPNLHVFSDDTQNTHTNKKWSSNCTVDMCVPPRETCLEFKIFYNLFCHHCRMEYCGLPSSARLTCRMFIPRYAYMDDVIFKFTHVELCSVPIWKYHHFKDLILCHMLSQTSLLFITRYENSPNSSGSRDLKHHSCLCARPYMKISLSRKQKNIQIVDFNIVSQKTFLNNICD